MLLSNLPPTTTSNKSLLRNICWMVSSVVFSIHGLFFVHSHNLQLYFICSGETRYCFFKSLEGIICPVVNVSSQSWFIRYIYYWNFQILNIKIISLRHIWPWPSLAILIRSCCFLIPKDFILFDIFPNVGYQELLVRTKLDIYVFIFWIDSFCVTK